MSLSNIDFDGISESDLIEQISAGVPEGVFVDYKREMYGRSDADAKEFLKDISSFANTAGGHLIIGVDEAAGIPTGIAAVRGDPDQDLQRLENLARDGIEPRTGERVGSRARISGRASYEDRFRRCNSAACKKPRSARGSSRTDFGIRFKKPDRLGKSTQGSRIAEAYGCDGIFTAH
jgi:hypothetical protein